MTNPNELAPTQPTVSVPIPAGLTAEQTAKLFGTFANAHEYGKKRDKAIRNAFTALKVKYPNDFRSLLNTELKKVGLPVK